jgi:hypothetical protein
VRVSVTWSASRHYRHLDWLLVRMLRATDSELEAAGVPANTNDVGEFPIGIDAFSFTLLLFMLQSETNL